MVDAPGASPQVRIGRAVGASWPTSDCLVDGEVVDGGGEGGFGGVEGGSAGGEFGLGGVDGVLGFVELGDEAIAEDLSASLRATMLAR